MKIIDLIYQRIYISINPGFAQADRAAVLLSMLEVVLLSNIGLVLVRYIPLNHPMLLAIMSGGVVFGVLKFNYWFYSGKGRHRRLIEKYGRRASFKKGVRYAYLALFILGMFACFGLTFYHIIYTSFLLQENNRIGSTDFVIPDFLQ